MCVPIASRQASQQASKQASCHKRAGLSLPVSFSLSVLCLRQDPLSPSDPLALHVFFHPAAHCTLHLALLAPFGARTGRSGGSTRPLRAARRTLSRRGAYNQPIIHPSFSEGVDRGPAFDAASICLLGCPPPPTSASARFGSIWLHHGGAEA